MEKDKLTKIAYSMMKELLENLPGHSRVYYIVTIETLIENTIGELININYEEVMDDLETYLNVAYDYLQGGYIDEYMFKAIDRLSDEVSNGNVEKLTIIMDKANGEQETMEVDSL